MLTVLTLCTLMISSAFCKELNMSDPLVANVVQYFKNITDLYDIGEYSSTEKLATSEVTCSDGQLVRCWCGPGGACAGGLIEDKNICRAYAIGGTPVLPIAECVPEDDNVRYEVKDSGEMSDDPSVECPAPEDGEIAKIVACAVFSEDFDKQPDTTGIHDGLKCLSKPACKNCRMQVHCSYTKS